MKNLLVATLLFPLLTFAQVQPNGSVMGNQTAIPVAIASAGYALGQALIYYPDDYFLPKNAGKRYPLYVFLHGAGEGSKDSIKEVLNTSLPQLIAQGLKPYAIDPDTKDTVKFIVVSPHCPKCGGSYSYPQLQYTIPYIFANYRVDTSCVWVGGLSSGARGTWSVVMGNIIGDTALGKRITGIMPMANGGYDNRTDLFPNLDTIARRGLATLYIIGDQDPGYNQIGFFTYQATMKKYSQAGRYLDTVIVGGTHSANVWNIPFPLTARIWSKSMNVWTQMWSMRKKAAAAVVVNPVKARISIDSTVLSYPNTLVNLADASIGNSWTSWGAYAYPTGYPGLWVGPCNLKQMVYAGLLPGGAYGIQLVVGDNNGNVDTARVQISVGGPPRCPVCPVCPVCPPPRMAIGFTIDAVTGKFSFKYDDENP